jgi:flagellar motor switch protein FliM
MPATDILSQDEIDALLHGVDRGDIETVTPPPPAPNGARSYDFTSQDRIVRGRLPALEMIYERFVRLFRVSLFNLLRRSPEISAGTVQMIKFSEYVQGLSMPANMNLVRIRPLRGTSLLVLEPQLVFILVDNFFGGNGRFPTRMEGRDFTTVELRLVQLVLQRLFKDLTEAWSPVMEIELEHIGSEINPHFANIVSPSEVVATMACRIDLEGGGGDLHITLPYSMIEPIRELLEAGMQSDRSDRDARWMEAMRGEIEGADVDLRVALAETTLTLRELMEMRPGDVIPLDLPAEVVARVEEVPVFWARFGVSRGKVALKVDRPARPANGVRAAPIERGKGHE